MSNEKSSTAIGDERKKATNLQNALVNDSKSAFYATDKRTKTLLRKARNALYKKDIVFVNIYNGLENKKFLPEKVPLNSPFVEKKKALFIPRYIVLVDLLNNYRLIQPTLVYLARSAVDPKFCLLFVDLFTSKIYTYPMKKRNLLAKKMELFYKDIEKKIGQIEVINRSKI